jgi:hypothetical protein
VDLFYPTEQMETKTEILNEIAAPVGMPVQQKRTLINTVSWSTISQKETKGVFTRCSGYKALWQKIVFKVNLDRNLKSSSFRRRDKDFSGDVIELLQGNLKQILPSLTEEHSIPAPQFELFTICRILRAS